MRELIVATFADQPEIEIVGEIENQEEIPNTVEKNLASFDRDCVG